MATGTKFEAILNAYIECALWASVDEDGEPLDCLYTVGDFSPEALDAMRADCAAFCDANSADLADLDPVMVGHDFWLTRNGHGAGFWDRGYGDRGDRLARACRLYGESVIEIGDDGRLHRLY